tara:strand:- start:494 stop:697 length:204 start_codon:yes stop_codon:yes gene_type:complete
MKKTTIIFKLEKCVDKSLEALYDARDLLEEVEDIELDQLMNEIVEELECDIADKVENLRERIDKIFE